MIKSQFREWVARFKFPGLEEAYFGETIIAETEMQAEVKAMDAWRRVFPCDPPSVFTLIPGTIFINLDDAP